MTDISRREFIKVSSLATGGLLVSVYLAGCTTKESDPTTTTTTSTTSASTSTTTPSSSTTTTTEPAPTTTTTYPGDPNAQLRPNIYVLVDGTGAVTITAFRSELGQGIRTAIAMVVAEEMDAEWERVSVTQAPADSDYGDQNTGGSLSIKDHYEILRRAGAAVREVLIAAAARTWDVKAKDCSTEPGSVVHPDGATRLTYGELITAGVEDKAPRVNRAKPWKDPSQFRIVGQPTTLVDAADHISGASQYTNDLTLPGMRYAVIARCPTFGGRPAGYDRAAALAVPGVTDVLEVERGVAVVADHTWAALQGREALNVSWNRGSLAGTTSAGIQQRLIDKTRSVGSSQIGAAYDIPYLAHAALEPMGAVADVRSDGCDVWAPTQNPQGARRTVQNLTGFSRSAVTVHVPPVGGKFGRGHYHDAVTEAVLLSRALGAPVKLLWTREDDMCHDRYHPMSRYQATAPASGRSRPSVRSNSAGSPVPIGAWRSVGNHPTAFARECLIDEVAAANGADPVDLRMQIMGADARRVIELAAAKSGWGDSLPSGWGRGIAYFSTFDVTPVAQVAEVSVTGTEIRVHRVVCAIDCGTVVNPDTVRAQMEGGIAYGLTAALKDGITIDDGAVVQSNFHDYRLLPFDEMPEVEVHTVVSTNRPTGVGEMGVPPIAPAVANAVFAATGRRLRSLPLRL